MSIYKGEKSGQIYKTTDGNPYYWLFNKKQVEFNIETTDGSNFKSHFRTIWTGDYVVEDKVLKDYKHSNVAFDYRETFLNEQSSGKTGYSHGYALDFDTPVDKNADGAVAKARAASIPAMPQIAATLSDALICLECIVRTKTKLIRNLWQKKG